MKILLTIFVLCILAVNSYSEEMGLKKDYSREISFTLGQQTLGNTRTFGIDVADVDMDEDIDVFIADYIGTSKLWLNDGNGFFTQSPQYFPFQEAHDVVIEDLNGDTYPDLFICCHATPSKIYFNDGSGSFTDSQQDIGTATDYPGMIVMGDVDGDDDLDAFISYYQIPNRLWLNDGSGFFSVTQTLYGEDGDPGGMELSDLNDDTFLDLILGMFDQTDQIWFNDGSGNFTNSGQALGNSEGYDRFDSIDIDGDTDNDIIVANSADGLNIWLNEDNTGTFTSAGGYFGDPSYGAEFCDVDSDGDPDLITIHYDSITNLWINDGVGNFTLLSDIFEDSDALRVAWADIDGDLDNDVILGEGENTGGNPIYFNESTPVDVNYNLLIPDIQIQNYPNPFNPSTTISFETMNMNEFSQIEIYNLKGQKVKTLPINSSTDQPINSIIWNGTDQSENPVSSGIYYYKWNIPNSPIKKMLLLK